jgi:hypothetical protein
MLPGSDAAKFLSVVLASLTAMLRLELPHINVLSKVPIGTHATTSLDPTANLDPCP